MLTTAEALRAVLDAVATTDSETVSLAQASGRVLQQTVLAERDQPPFDRVMMDGIAFAFADYDENSRRLPLQAMQAAGDPALNLDNGHCIEIMTGASLPVGSDCIVPVERITVDDGIAEIEIGYAVAKDRFIHPRGSDYAKGAHLLRPGKLISPLDIAVIASCGLTEVDVAADPVVRVISTGNELIPPGEAIEPHQIRMSNGPALVALLQQHGYQRCTHDHIADDLTELKTKLQGHLDDANVLVLSGGVSMGKADFVPQVLDELGVKRVFHRISQRPGKPMWFGVGPEGQLVFALPGNPVSALVCCRQYVVPALRKASGVTEQPPQFAQLASSVSFKPALTCFQPVKLVSSVAGQILAMPVKTNTSGDFASLSGTDGYVELAQDQTNFPAGSALRLRRWAN